MVFLFIIAGILPPINISQHYRWICNRYLVQILRSNFISPQKGALATWMMKKGRFMVKHAAISTAFTVYCGYIAFSFCEVFEFSGVAAVLICGALMQHYLTYNLSKAASKSSR